MGTEVSEVKNNIHEVEKKLNTETKLQHEKNIETTNKIFQIQGEINYLAQLQIDNDVMITGFQKKPDTQYVIAKLLQYYCIEQNLIKSSYTYDIKTKNGTKGVMILSFANKHGQLLFREKRLELGPITLSQLIPEKVPDNQNVTMRIVSKLTPNNQHIQRELRQLLNNNKISAIKYRNCSFHFQREAESAFIPVMSPEFLNDYMKSFDDTTY
jgi:hypothetical protein